MAAKPPQSPDGFLSYTRFDDEYHGGAISAFREQLSMAVRAVTAKPFEIFQDVGGIGLGEKWRKRLNIALGEARFFIPILTPSYFESKACRDELQTFLEFEAEGGRDDLILPIYWLRCRVLEDGNLRARDPLAEMINGRQRSNWLNLRHKSFTDPEVRESLEALAEQIEEARSRTLPEAPRSQSEARRTLRRRAEESPADRKNEIERRPRANTEPAGERKESKDREPSWAEILASIRRIIRDEESEEVYARKDADLSATSKTLETPSSAQLSSLLPGTVFRDIDAPWCPELVIIPPGEFMMGSTEAERQWAVEQGADREWMECEKPRHRVGIAFPLAVGRYAVTFEEYDHFAKATGHMRPHDQGWGRGRRPVNYVSWDDAKAYLEWLAAVTGENYRLLSEAEWEYACRAGTTTRFWWGDEITPENANYGGCVGKTSEVGSYPANPFGLYDTHGNIWEWVEDRWHDSYDGAPDDGSTWIVGSDSSRVLRGGSRFDRPDVLRSAHREKGSTILTSPDEGFRVARDAYRLNF